MSRLLATPLILPHHTLKNRIIMGSMHTGFEEYAEGAEHLAEFYAQRAKGGAALIITGGIAPNKQGIVFEHGAKLTNDTEAQWHRPITKAVHQHNSKICLQILHTGRYAAIDEPVAPSAIRAPINPATPRALSLAEIEQTIQDYIRCAQLAQSAGYDGVEIMGSEGYLINQFLAPATNQRQDAYGGSLDNRHRLAVDIAQGIRQNLGERFLIIFRLSVLDLVANGSTWEENQILAQKLEAAGVDMFNTGIGWHEARVPTIATCVPRAAFSQFTAKLKSASNIPVIATNRINMPEVAERILAQDVADAVCLARPFLADPEWGNKAIAQADNSINTCIACNQACLDHIFEGKLTSCLVNPFACHEKQLILEPSETPQHIAVIGAGPAGMAFAHTAAQRGHCVTLIDQQPQIGGQLNIAKTIPGKPEFHETIRYFEHVLNQHPNITLKLNINASEHDFSPYQHIVLATGITPRTPDIEGIDHPKVLSYLDVLREHRPVGNKVAIIGAGGIGFDTAEYLAHQGADSALHPEQFIHEWQIDPTLAARGAILNPRPNLLPAAREIWLLQRKAGTPGKKLGKTTGWIHRLSLANQGVHMLGGISYRKIDDQGLHISRDGEESIIPADTIVICAGQEANRSLEAYLAPFNKPIHIIGGADKAGELDAKRAIKQGTELALSI